MTFLQLAAGRNGKFGPGRIFLCPRAIGLREEKKSFEVRIFLTCPTLTEGMTILHGFT